MWSSDSDRDESVSTTTTAASSLSPSSSLHPGVGRARSLTDDDLEELKGCVDQGFGFSYNEIPELCGTLPALKLCYSMSQRFLDEHHSPSKVEQVAPEPPAVATAGKNSRLATAGLPSGKNSCAAAPSHGFSDDGLPAFPTADEATSPTRRPRSPARSAPSSLSPAHQPAAATVPAVYFF